MGHRPAGGHPAADGAVQEHPGRPQEREAELPLTLLRPPRRRRPLVVTAALAVLLAGCGTASEDGPRAGVGAEGPEAQETQEQETREHETQEQETQGQETGGDASAPGDLLPTEGGAGGDTGETEAAAEDDETGQANETGDEQPSEEEGWGSWEDLGTDGIPGCDVLDLPATALNTIDDIEVGGPYEFPRNDGVTFQNREGILPDEAGGYYREFTVVTPGLDHRGARRIVTGGPEETDPDHWYYTEDHYESFCEFDPAGLDF